MYTYTKLYNYMLDVSIYVHLFLNNIFIYTVHIIYIHRVYVYI